MPGSCRDCGQRPLGERDDHQPGQQVTFDVGLRYALSRSLSAQLQLNLLWKDRDQGLNAEPDDSGGRYVFLSPGASHALTTQLQLYGFLPLPLYQYVNGTPLTVDWPAVAGISWKMCALRASAGAAASVGCVPRTLRKQIRKTASS